MGDLLAAGQTHSGNLSLCLIGGAGDQRRPGRLADATICLAGLSDGDLSGCPTSRMGRRARSEPPSDAPWRLPMSALAPERERVPPFVKSVSTSTKPINSSPVHARRGAPSPTL